MSAEAQDDQNQVSDIKDNKQAVDQKADANDPNNKPKEEEDIFKIFGFGNGELDQMPVKYKDEDIKETRIPLPINLPTGVKVYKIACGSLHTLILTTSRDVFSFGNNDDGALGRPTSCDADLYPKQVDLGTEKADDVQGGEVHSIAYNESKIFVWGAYRVNLFYFYLI